MADKKYQISYYDHFGDLKNVDNNMSIVETMHEVALEQNGSYYMQFIPHLEQEEALILRTPTNVIKLQVKRTE